MNSAEVAKQVTQKILEELRSNPGKWIKSWETTRPRNLITGHEYSGFNWMWLNMNTDEKHGMSPYWMTYNQAKQITGLDKPIKKGAKSVPIIFYKPISKVDEQGKEHWWKMVRSYNVFNRDNVEGMSPLPEPEEVKFRKDNCDTVIKRTGAELQVGYDKACYIPSMDLIQVPKITKFKTAEDYYATTFHELTHWTGHKKRLDRDLNNRFGDKAYAFEELVAELGAAMLCNANGVEGKLQHTEYINSWLEVLEKDTKNIMKASALAQKAFDFIMGTKPFIEKELDKV